MTKAPINLQDLKRRISEKARSEPSGRFWGLYAHVHKMETLQAAYRAARQNNGAPGIDGVTFAAIEASGRQQFLSSIHLDPRAHRYAPHPSRKVGIPKGDGEIRELSIPSIRDRVVQGALRLILEPIFEADFQPGSFAYRPGRGAHHAIHRVLGAIEEGKTQVIDLDIHRYFDSIRHHILFEKGGPEG